MSSLLSLSRRQFIGSCLALSIGSYNSCLAAQTNSTNFVFLSDCHLSAKQSDTYKLTAESQLFLQNAIKQINRLQPDFVIFGGDQIDGSQQDDSDWQLFLDIAQSLECPWYFALGESDVSGPAFANKMISYGRDWRGHGLQNDFPYWSYDPAPGIHLIALDTSMPNSTTGNISDEQLNWLKNDLAIQNDSLVLLVSHHPLWSPAPFDQGFAAAQFLLPQAQAVRQILIESGKQILALSGHIYVSAMLQQNNISYISSAGLDVYPCVFKYFQLKDNQLTMKTCQIEYPALIKKAKEALRNSNFAANLSGNHPNKFISFAVGNHADQDTTLNLSKQDKAEAYGQH